MIPRNLFFIFTSIGVFVCSCLFLTDYFHFLIPCGDSSGCEKVRNDSWSHFLGIPISLTGLLSYILILILSILASKNKKIRLFIMIFLFVSSLISIIFTLRSGLVIHSYCIWCLSSMVCICLMMFIFVNFLYNHGYTISRKDQYKIGALFVISILGSFIVVKNSKKDYYAGLLDKINKKMLLKIVKTSEKRIGNRHTDEKIIMFGDFQCPVCRTVLPKLTEIVKNDKEVSLFFVNSPKSDEEIGNYIGLLSEISQEKNRFQDFSKYLTSIQDISIDDINKKMYSFGFKSFEIIDIMSDESSPAVIRFKKDLKLSSDLKITVTPTVFLVDKNDSRIRLIPIESLHSIDSIKREIYKP